MSSICVICGWHLHYANNPGCCPAVEASAEWQHLFQGGSNSPTCGAVVHARGRDFAPASVTVNGAPAKVLVQTA